MSTDRNLAPPPLCPEGHVRLTACPSHPDAPGAAESSGAAPTSPFYCSSCADVGQNPHYWRDDLGLSETDEGAVPSGTSSSWEWRCPRGHTGFQERQGKPDQRVALSRFYCESCRKCGEHPHFDEPVHASEFSEKPDWY